ncbi:MAG: hypothetical protein GY859_30970 [Desulfobacterales bacterium]|nr:hypothetical protein [Desulfobacterales bacterium]
MRTQSILTISAIFLAAMLFISPAWGGSSGEQRISYNSYEGYIDKQIRHHEFKATLGSSVAPNLQKDAEVSREKAAFFKEHRDAMIRNMRADNVDAKPYKMTHYLNRTFYDYFPDSFRDETRSADVVAAGTYKDYIDEQIRHHEFKASLGSASTPNLQKSAEVSREKAEFLKTHKRALIRGMEIANVEKKPYKMTHYLNLTFYNSTLDYGSLLVADAGEENKKTE